jgi:phosphatidate cytidylyltransferase
LFLLVVDFQLGQRWIGRTGVVVCSLAIVVSWIAAGELLQMLRRTDQRSRFPLESALSALMVAFTCIPVVFPMDPKTCPFGFFGWTLIGFTTAVGLTAIHEIIRFAPMHRVQSSTISTIETRPSSSATDRLASAILVYSYLMILFSFLAAHRSLNNDNALGMIALVNLITAVKMSDTAAYIVGKTLGSRKIAPILSPGKTVEGAIGSLIGAWVGTLIVLYVVAPWLFELKVDKPIWWSAVYGVLVGLAGIVGDLTESIFKRDADRKDSSQWLPGLGGVLDITDSLVFAAPVSFFLWFY